MQRVNELENAAIQAQAAGAIPLATTRVIVQFCVAADQTLAATPTGWQATVKAAWASAKAQLPPISNVALAAAVSGIDVALAALGGN